MFLATLNVLACLGFARFSLGATLPFMGEALHFSYQQMGLVASATFFGYLVSAMFVGYAVNAFSFRKVIIASLVLISIGMVGNYVVDYFINAYISCLFIGIGSGGANIATLNFVNQLFDKQTRGKALGVVNSGSGIGMVISGMLIHLLIAPFPEYGWRMSYLVMFCFVLSVAVLNSFFLEELAHGRQMKRKEQQSSIYRNKFVWLIGIIYFTWGFSYMFFSTFLVDYLIKDVHVSEKMAAYYFASAGVASIFSGFIWGGLSGRIGRWITLFFIFFIQASILLMMFFVTDHAIFLYFETIGYALTLWGVPTVLIAAVGDVMSERQAPIVTGFVTLLLGIGQWVSPIVLGWVLNVYENYGLVIVLSSLICYIGAAGCFYLYTYDKKSSIFYGHQ
ncbi:MFS transporter [Anoxybacillus salavatliensis]|nr:MFS transporter [Anoxybacillus gonensis]MCQ5364847.1 MFS transporter [Anoxybacillus gonensis]